MQRTCLLTLRNVEKVVFVDTNYHTLNLQQEV